VRGMNSRNIALPLNSPTGTGGYTEDLALLYKPEPRPYWPKTATAYLELPRGSLLLKVGASIGNTTLYSCN